MDDGPHRRRANGRPALPARLERRDSRGVSIVRNLRVKIAIAVALVVCFGVAGGVIYATRPAPPMSLNTGGVFTDNPCEMTLDVDGKVLIQRHVVFDHSNFPSAKQVALTIDAHSLTIADGLGHVVARQPRMGANTLGWDIKGPMSGDGGVAGWAEDGPSKMTLRIVADDYRASTGAGPDRNPYASNPPVVAR